MIKRTVAPKFFDIDEVVIDVTRNVRETGNYNLEPLIDDIQMRGQQDPVTLEKINGKLYPIKGFRRTSAIAEANRRGLKYGDEAQDAGKPINKVLAVVYEDLSERERVELLLDHGQRQGLNKVELQNAFERAFGGDYKDKQIVTLLYGLLTVLYPPTRNIGADLDKSDPKYAEKMEQARFEYYKGVLQVAKRAWKAPSVLREAYYKRLRGEQKWPTNDELKDLVNIHDKESEADPLVSRENPGPKFLEKWNALTEAKKGDSGKTRVQVTMRNRSQVEESAKTVEGVLTKVPLHIQLGTISIDRLPVYDKMMVKLWNGEPLTDEDKAEILSWFPKKQENA